MCTKWPRIPDTHKYARLHSNTLGTGGASHSKQSSNPPPVTHTCDTSIAGGVPLGEGPVRGWRCAHLHDCKYAHKANNRYNANMYVRMRTHIFNKYTPYLDTYRRVDDIFYGLVAGWRRPTHSFRMECARVLCTLLVRASVRVCVSM